MTDNNSYEAVRVHISGADPGVMPAAQARRKVVRFDTYMLTASDPVQCVLPGDRGRCAAYVQALDNDVVLATSAGQAQPNTAIADLSAAGVQVYGQLVTKASGSEMTPVEGTNAVYAACATAKPARVSVQTVSYA